MKSILLAATILLSTNAFSQTIFSECYNYAMATGNVAENKFKVRLNTELATEADYQALEAVASKPYFSVLPATEYKNFVTYVYKADLNEMNAVENALEYLNKRENIKVSCKYNL